ALLFYDATLNYRELNLQANQLAHYLIRAGIGPETVVAVALPRSIEMVVSFLAILKAGGVYLPLDPAYPSKRLAYMFEEAKPKCVLTSSHFAENLPGQIPALLLNDRDLLAALVRQPQTNPTDAERVQPLK